MPVSWRANSANGRPNCKRGRQVTTRGPSCRRAPAKSIGEESTFEVNISARELVSAALTAQRR